MITLINKKLCFRTNVFIPGPCDKGLGLLSMWLEIRFLTHVYGENLVGRGEFTLCVTQVPRLRLIIANDGENFVIIS
jgi:hypothetical protein